MRKATLVLLALGLVVATTALASNAVRISQVYPNGGYDAANGYKCDYVELFNYSHSPVDIGGWSVQYKSSSGNFAHSGTTHRYALIPAGKVIPPCGYFLVTGYCSATTGLDLPTSDAPNPGPGNTLNMGGSGNVQVALFSDQVLNRTCAEAKASPNLVDLVGYGATSDCFEGASTANGGNLLVHVRKQGGMQDTDNNLADFTIVSQLASVPSPVVHNSLSPSFVDCEIATPTKGTSWGQIKTIYR